MTGSSPCQCTTTLNGEQKETKNVKTNHKTVASYGKFSRGRWTFLGPGAQKEWYGTYTDKPDGSWDQTAQNMMANFSGSGHPIFRASSAFERGELRSKGGGKKSKHFNGQR